MTILEMADKAHQNYFIAGRLADLLRFKLGMNYDQILAWVSEKNDKINPALWDQLMYEADEEGL